MGIHHNYKLNLGCVFHERAACSTVSDFSFHGSTRYPQFVCCVSLICISGLVGGWVGIVYIQYMGMRGWE